MRRLTFYIHSNVAKLNGINSLLINIVNHTKREQ